MTARTLWKVSTPLIVIATLALAVQGRARAADQGRGVKRYSLDQLISLARKHYPGVEAARRAVGIMEAKLFQAKWAWLPQATVKGFVAPSTEIKCQDRDGNPDAACLYTNRNPTSNVSDIAWAGLYGRIDAEFGMPIYTFDKLSSARKAATAGVAISRAQVLTTTDKLVQDVTRAYWGLKLAQEILYTIKEGMQHLDKAITKVEGDLDEGKGEVTETDLLRLKVSKAEVESRVHEARMGEALARATLQVLTGQRERRDFGVDHKVLELVDDGADASGKEGPGDAAPPARYIQLAQSHRPEVRLLDAAVEARQAKVELEKARFWPDLALVAMVGIARAMGVDDPQNAFLSDPFNYAGAGFGLALQWKWDQVLQYGRYKEARAEALETQSRRKEALAGIALEVQKTTLELDEARKRLESLKSGQRSARSWLVATSQNLSMGTSEPKDLTDALVAFFSLKLRYLQAIYDVNVRRTELKRVLGTSPGAR